MKVSNFNLIFLLYSSIFFSAFSFAQSIGENPFSTEGIVPACKDASSDTDGDGWGWENLTSCHVGSSFVREQQHPDCKSSNSDTDGDGWGWDGNSSCRVGSVNSTSSSFHNVQPNEVECVDSDGDGWGWDGSKSCRVK